VDRVENQPQTNVKKDNKMEKSIKLGLLGVCLAVGAVQGGPITYTNVTAQALTITLTAQVQGSGDTVYPATLNNKELLAIWGLPASAKLLVGENVGAIARFTTTTNTVIDYAIASTNLSSTKGAIVVTNATTKYSIDQYTVSAVSATASVSANLQGYTAKTIATKAASATVAGSGTGAGAPAVFQGTLTAGPEKTTTFETAKYKFVPVQ
jgi:hypothetical protein